MTKQKVVILLHRVDCMLHYYQNNRPCEGTNRDYMNWNTIIKQCFRNDFIETMLLKNMSVTIFFIYKTNT